MADLRSGAMHPPRPELALKLGITGHRALGTDGRAALVAALDDLFARIADKVAAIGQAHADLFGDCAPVLTLVSPLAEGADQIAAAVALGRGFTLHALLPFARDTYAEDFKGAALARFEALLARAEAVWALPAPRSLGTRGYVLAGEATVAQSDILIAAWDGEEARGPGGTAEVVDIAVRRGVPVIHLPTGSADAPTILWAGFEDVAPELLRSDDAPRRPLDRAALEEVLDALLAPPDAMPELTLFLAEHERRVRSRPEWALLLATVGVQPIRRASFRAAGYAETARLDWETYHQGVADACGPAARMEVLESAFAWADGLAQHYANVFRSGVVLNFAGAALAVLLSLAASLLPGEKLELLVAELLIIAAVVANTAHGTKRQWHRRWLDYRFLAEQLRPLRSLKLLGAASAAVRSSGASRRWTDWYAQALWRSLGAPPTLAGPDALGRLARHIAAHELDGQVGYHRASAHRMHVLDHRLHQIGLTLFAMTILIGLGTLGGLLFAHELTKQIAPVLGMLSAALPTLGAAIFGIRGAGDFAGTAGRSAETARRLAHAASLLRRDPIDHKAAVRASEEAASIMLADLGEWRSTYTHRKLAIPS
ncbi:MAG TPA: hypothetical protein VK533_07660 [Sphingomonas sp.]|uniref:DUF4231 domain-containing protein n=1 Tax=Sphingomonas sp. TaxID=28214 RepID=UPI002B582A4E|nr:hypothetical protein [Sphingomonas sp.]HMI19403.1 hypothetical protein [Sphingomonas sp.]